MNKSIGAHPSSGGNSYALRQHSDNREVTNAGLARVNLTSPAYSGRHKSDTGNQWAGSEERIIQPIDEERHSERSTDRIVRKADVTMAYENMRAQSSDSFR